MKTNLINLQPSYSTAYAKKTLPRNPPSTSPNIIYPVVAPSRRFPPNQSSVRPSNKTAVARMYGAT